jgi:hypothetical protein
MLFAAGNLGLPDSSVMGVSSDGPTGASSVATGSRLIDMSSSSVSAGSATADAIVTSSTNSSGLRWRAVGAGIVAVVGMGCSVGEGIVDRIWVALVNGGFSNLLLLYIAVGDVESILKVGLDFLASSRNQFGDEEGRV